MHLQFPDAFASERLRMRPLCAADVTERYLGWFRDPAVTRYLESRDLTREAVIAHFEAGEASNAYRVYAVCERESGLHIGNIKLGPVNVRHATGDCVAVIGARGAVRGGVGREAIRAATQAGFSMGLRKLCGSAYRSNQASIRAYCAAGWVVEAILHADLTLDGVPEDRVMLSCFNAVDATSPLPTFPLPLTDWAAAPRGGGSPG